MPTLTQRKLGYGSENVCAVHIHLRSCITTITPANCISGGQTTAKNRGQRATGTAEKRALLFDAVQTGQVNETVQS